MFVFVYNVVLFRVGKSICDELITRAKECYHVCNKSQNPKEASENVDRLSNPKKNMLILTFQTLLLTIY
jgi:hypothetical protein